VTPEEKLRNLIAMVKYGPGINVTEATPTGKRAPFGPWAQGTREAYSGTRHGLPWSGQEHARDDARGLGGGVMAGVLGGSAGTGGSIGQLPGEKEATARAVIELLRRSGR
jgi:hypothetical protein